MGRRASREVVMKLLYQLELQKGNRQEQIDLVLEDGSFSSNDKNYILDVVDGVYEHEQEIDGMIEKALKGWMIDRISKLELAVLRLAIYEIKYREDIPVKVTFNEAIELTKKYVGPDKTSFINGLLGTYVDEDNYVG
ncbi:MAG: transcription antitermination factor NusB [Clostridiales bacterium]|nr:transcription antitermination factor NusB [Clostridiales bacterium]